jgi:hypothetical protein
MRHIDYDKDNLWQPHEAASYNSNDSSNSASNNDSNSNANSNGNSSSSRSSGHDALVQPLRNLTLQADSNTSEDNTMSDNEDNSNHIGEYCQFVHFVPTHQIISLGTSARIFPQSSLRPGPIRY